MTNFSEISADPLYLTALANLGSSIPAKLTAAPSNGSIAVLPFVDMSGEVGHEHFTDGLTEDIITDLSNVPGFFVIARNSVFAYKGKPTDVRQIAHDLGVKYILEGSARRAGQRLRINVQLINASEGGNHIWAERFDRDLRDIFVVQDEVTRRIVEAITGKLNSPTSPERQRPSNVEAYDLVVRSRNIHNLSRAGCREASALLTEAIALDPNFAEAHRRLAMVHAFGWIEYDEPEQAGRQLAMKSALRALELDPTDSGAYSVYGYILLHERRWEEAELAFNKSLQLNANDADSTVLYAYFKFLSGLPAESVELVGKALRLNPKPPGWYYWVLGDAQIALGNYEDAVLTLRQEETFRLLSRKSLAAALAFLGRTSEALAECKYFLEAYPGWSIRNGMRTQPFKDPDDAKFWADAFRLAGLPE